MATFVPFGGGHGICDRCGMRLVEPLPQQSGFGGGVNLAKRHLNGVLHERAFLQC
jgi:hypothetical protein